MEFIDDDAEEDVIESFTESADAHGLVSAFSAAASLTREDDEIESFGESAEDLAQAAPPNNDESTELEYVSLADSIRQGQGSDCERAASAVTRVMIALKQRKLETPEGTPMDVSDIIQSESGRVRGVVQAVVDDADIDDTVDLSDDDADEDYHPERPEEEYEVDTLLDDELGDSPDSGDVTSDSDEANTFEDAGINHDWLRNARKYASRKVRGRAYHQGISEHGLAAGVTLLDHEYVRLDNFAGDLGARTINVVFDVGNGTPRIILEERVHLGDALARLRVGASYEAPLAAVDAHGKGSLIVDSWVRDDDPESDNVLIVTRDALDGIDRGVQGTFMKSRDLYVDSVKEEQLVSESPELKGFHDKPMKDLLSLSFVPRSHWTVRVLHGTEKPVEFAAPSLRLGLFEPSKERLRRAATAFFVDANRPPKARQGDAKYFPRLVHGAIKARQELSRGALTITRVRESLALAAIFTDIIGSSLSCEPDVAARAAHNIVIHVQHALSDDLERDGLPSCAYVCQLDGRDDILRLVLRKCQEGHVSAIMKNGVTSFQKLVGLRQLGFTYESSLGLNGLASAPTMSELKALKKPPVDHYQRHVLQLSVTALSTFAERRCERAFCFDIKGMTSDERPAVMHARLVGQVSQTFPVFERFPYAANNSLISNSQKWEDRTVDMITSSRPAQEGVLEFRDLGKKGATNQSTNASLVEFLQTLARRSPRDDLVDTRVVENDARERAYVLHKCTMQLSHDEMCDVFSLTGSERDACRFGTFEPDFLHIQYTRNLWEITIIDAKVRL